MRKEGSTPRYDVAIVGGSFAGQSAGEQAAKLGLKTSVIEQYPTVDARIKTSGAVFLDRIEELEIPPELLHPIQIVTIISPNNQATFDFDKEPVLAIADVRGLHRHLAEKTVKAGSELRLRTKAVEPITENGYAVGVKVISQGKTTEIRSSLLIDASGYKAEISKKAGIGNPSQRVGVASEHDFIAPAYDQRKVTLIIGNEIAPTGYAWAFPWGKNRVKVGVVLMRPDSNTNPAVCLKKLVSQSSRFGINLNGATLIENHGGSVPAAHPQGGNAGNGIIKIGDAHNLVFAATAEGIRLAMTDGKRAGEIAQKAVKQGNFSKSFLESKYRELIGTRDAVNLRAIDIVSQHFSRFDDKKLDKMVDLIKLLTNDQFAQTMQSNLVSPWMAAFILSHPISFFKSALGLARESRNEIKGSGLELA